MNKCLHNMIMVVTTVMLDGRLMRREYCANCLIKISNLFLPNSSDQDVIPMVKKHHEKTLGEILEVDKDYMEWIVKTSKQPDSVKKAASRLLKGQPFILRPDKVPYPFHERYEIFIKNALK